MIQPSQVIQVLGQMGWHFLQKSKDLHLFEYHDNPNVKGPIILDLPEDGCSEQVLQIPLERNGIEWMTFVQLLETI